MISRIRTLLRRVRRTAPQPLRVEGVEKAPMTAEPDDAELAAQALLEHMAASGKSRNNDISKSRKNKKGADAPHDADYYRHIAESVRNGRVIERRMTLRFLSYVEEQLEGYLPPQAEQMLLVNLEQGLYDHLDVIEREGGDLKKRWQHCLADVTVRLMQNASQVKSEE